MSDLFVRNTLKHRVFLLPSEIQNNVDETVLKAIKNQIGGKCIKEGYVQKDSIQIIKRSAGKVDAVHLNGRIGYDVLYSAEVCNPVEGMTLKGEIADINKIGAICNIPPISINLPKKYHSNIEIFKDLAVGDKVEVSIVGCIFEVYDKELNAVGLIQKRL